MSKKEWKYFHKGDNIGDAQVFASKIIWQYAESDGSKNPEDETHILTNKIKIVIEIYEDEN